VLEELPAEALADPGGLDPEILEPTDLAARDQGCPADRAAVLLGDIEQTRA
jgi:hypothetical protein